MPTAGRPHVQLGCELATAESGSFFDLCDRHSQRKARAFWRAVLRDKAAFDWVLNFARPDGRIQRMRLSAVILDDNVLVLAAEHDGDSSSSLGTNIYDQLSGLINELTVAHREAAKNAKLMRVAMEDERRGREGLEELHDRVRFLANAGQQCAQHASNVEEFVRTVLTLTLAVPVLGDFCTITVAANEITRIAQGRHVDPDLKASLDGALERNVVEEVFRNDYGADVLSFPLITCRPDEARICVGRASSAYTNDERALAEQFANIVSVALDNALLYERQRSISEVLQRALLPTALPGSQAFVMDALRTKQ